MMKVNPSIVFAGFISLALCAMPLLAHHSTAAEYDISKTITIQGTVTSIEWVNPHARLTMKADNRDQWELEMASPNALVKAGTPRGFVKQGGQVSVALWRAKDGSLLGYPLTITFPDGRAIDLARTWMNALNPVGDLRH